MKRKLVSLLMVTAMSAAMLAGCGGDDSKQDANQGGTDQKEENAGDNQEE